MKLDARDKTALQKLDADFTFTPDNERAVVKGEMAVKVIRTSNDRLQMTLEFPGAEEFIVLLARAQLLDQLDVEDNES